MEDVELRHWMRAATVRTALGCARTTRQALQAFGSAARASRNAVEVSPSGVHVALRLATARHALWLAPCSVQLSCLEPVAAMWPPKEGCNKQVRTERGVLPVGHPQRTDAVLADIVAAVERDDMLTAAASLSDFVDEEALQVAEVRLSGHLPALPVDCFIVVLAERDSIMAWWPIPCPFARDLRDIHVLATRAPPLRCHPVRARCWPQHSSWTSCTGSGPLSRSRPRPGTRLPPRWSAANWPRAQRRRRR